MDQSRSAANCTLLAAPENYTEVKRELHEKFTVFDVINLSESGSEANSSTRILQSLEKSKTHKFQKKLRELVQPMYQLILSETVRTRPQA